MNERFHGLVANDTERHSRTDEEGGLAAASMATRVVKSLLCGVAPSDVISQVAAVLAMFIVALVAASVPARRAARVDPVIALRAA
jgi:ABC-type lipoprotein release transport system permease subunit